ncbi:MAG: hypothetical protein OIN84_10315, partial [Candidatus Methanoperedens sp.]|nr:hypothetical protein [Candidatus Methanoperedens sp.]
KNGDNRPPSQMGFEFTRSTLDGQEETQVIVVQDMLDAAAELDPLAHHCQGCPANAQGKPFGCMGYIEYPISQQGERWLLNQLPTPEEPLVWLLLRQGIEEFGYDGSSIQKMRGEDLPYFEDSGVLARLLGEFQITANQIFEMTFGVGHIQPSHAGVLLLFFKTIARDLEADAIMNISQASGDVPPSFLLEIEDGDDKTVAQIKMFLYALYIAWTLNVPLLLDV